MKVLALATSIAAAVGCAATTPPPPEPGARLGSASGASAGAAGSNGASAAPPRPGPDDRPQVLRPRVVDGDTRLRLPDATLRRLDAAGVSELVVTVMVCIDEAGVPTRVNLKSPSHDPEIDALVEARVHELRFEPMVADGKAITPCFAVRLTFVLSP